jgi:hypothetical protein
VNAVDFLKACEEAPGDSTVLLAAADYYDSVDEGNDPRLAAALRWMAEYDRRPFQLPVPGRRPWMWTCYGGIREGIPHACLPSAYCNAVGFREGRCFKTFAEAVCALSDAIGSAGWRECPPNPEDIDPETREQLQAYDEQVRKALADLGHHTEGQ